MSTTVPVPDQLIIPWVEIRKEQLHCCKVKLFSDDWSSFFPETVWLELDIKIGTKLTLRDVLQYARRRLDHAEYGGDRTGWLEASQCLMLVHRLSSKHPLDATLQFSRPKSKKQEGLPSALTES